MLDRSGLEDEVDGGRSPRFNNWTGRLAADVEGLGEDVMHPLAPDSSTLDGEVDDGDGSNRRSAISFSFGFLHGDSLWKMAGETGRLP